jgi:phosphoenolpyruvate carboxykinase (diphosphate)
MILIQGSTGAPGRTKPALQKQERHMPTLSEKTSELNRKLLSYINVKLALLGTSAPVDSSDGEFTEIASALIARYREEERLLASYLCPSDQRIQTFLYDYLQDIPVAKLPNRTFVLDRPGLARVLSLPIDRDELSLGIIHSYRVKQGVLHNPKSDRRTTQGIFHVAEGGLPIPDDKQAVPKAVFGKLLALAFTPPRELMILPLTANQPQPAECFVSLLLRPVVCPEVPGFIAEKTMEIRFFVPGSLVSNLDFVESIFGNAGDPYLPDYDAGLDVEHWTGHTGCIILAPHLVNVTKKSLGLPQWKDASERQRRDGMAWHEENELYNSGRPFKLTCRDENGVILTLIADNYYGYCKKEVKTQISYSANLFGLCEEEHAGGALVFPSYDLGEDFTGNVHVRPMGHSFAEMVSLYGERMEVRPEGYAVDRKYLDIIYVPEKAHFDLQQQRVSWPSAGGQQTIKLLPGRTYIRPSGYQVHMEKPPANRAWRLIGTVAEGTFCHKPCTVSGGGKSEISKSISDAILHGPVFVANFKQDFDRVAELLNRDYSGRFKDQERQDHRPLLSPERSLGSVIKLLTPDTRDFTAEYNAWLEAIPQYIKELVFVVKRFYKPEWEGGWRDLFSVDVINGTPGNELKLDNRKLVTTFLRVGYDQDGAWRTFGLRKDFHPAAKLQQEDDITASVIVPAKAVTLPPQDVEPLAYKFVKNCEFRLFQRPDDAIHPGYDCQTEADFSQPGNFFSNYEPLTPADARELVEDSIGFARFTAPLQELIREVAETGLPPFFVSSAHPRKVDGLPSKNPRYLQMRPDLKNPRASYVAEMAMRLRRRLPHDQPLYTPVQAVLPGRRNNPPEGQIRSLAVFNPIHYLELPELFMEFICSMTGKSPSTTGAGSEGALTKGPFNALPPIIDLNNALVAWLLTGHHGFVTAAGYVGPRFRVDHDVSMLVPEVWCRMSVKERDPRFLIDNNYLEKCEDFKHCNRQVLAHRLGYRINARFVAAFFGRVFNHPYSVFTEEMLRPELQDLEIFVDGVDNIVSTQRHVAQMYFDDGSIAQACPPLKALLHIMARDHYEGKKLDSPEIRELFSREHLLASDWYRQRLEECRTLQCKLWTRHIRYLEKFLKRKTHADEAERLGIVARLDRATKTLQELESDSSLDRLRGTIGTQPVGQFLASAP